MLKSKVVTMAAAALTALSLAGADAMAADPPSRNARDLRDNTCKDVMLLSGLDRDVALAMAHGYVLGKRGTTKFEIDRLAEITDKFLDYCLDNPKANALESFEKVAK